MDDPNAKPDRAQTAETAGAPARSAIERLLFDRPALYRGKAFVIRSLIWDLLFTRILRRPPRPIPEHLLEARGQRVLLAACGPGIVSVGPDVGEARQVTAFDLSRRFAASCASRQPEWNLYCGDLRRLPHADDSFDVCAIYSTLHHLPDGALSVLQELGRVAPRVVVLEGLVPSEGLLRWALLLWYRLVDGGQHYYTLAELVETAKRAGLRVASGDLHGPIRHMWLATLERAAAPDSANR